MDTARNERFAPAQRDHQTEEPISGLQSATARTSTPDHLGLSAPRCFFYVFVHGFHASTRSVDRPGIGVRGTRGAEKPPREEPAAVNGAPAPRGAEAFGGATGG